MLNQESLAEIDLKPDGENDGLIVNSKCDESMYKSDNNSPESLPVAKRLVQERDEEEDMGYDEDDERIALQQSRTIGSKVEDYFMNEEGSGVSQTSGRNVHFEHKTKNLSPELSNEDEVNLRESSGNFANDDEDDVNDDNEDVTFTKENSNTDFFNFNHKSANQFYRKNINDAIKIISTPLGKVGIVYQQSKTDDAKSIENVDKKTTTLTDFDALSPDPESSYRLASSHPKITPVLTPDGKVALLYRGDSENSKYEPIRNMTHKFKNKIDDSLDIHSQKSINNKNCKSENRNCNNDGAESEKDVSETEVNTNSFPDGNLKLVNQKLNSETDFIQKILSTSTTYITRPTDSVLPIINRPLSEVLGIKKNQFKQFRVKDTATTEPSVRSGVPLDISDSTELHILTKVNLADYPTPPKTNNLDFDFSLDTTMLDERARHRAQHLEQHSGGKGSEEFSGNTAANTISNGELLSKTEVVNLAIIPHFDEDLQRLQRLQDHESSRHHHRTRHRQKQAEEDLSGIHCIMQAMMGIAAISTVFGMLGTFFKQRILDQIRLMHW